MSESRLGWGRLVAAGVVLVLVLLILTALVRRSQFPEGTFLFQQRSYVAERLNPDLGEVLTAVVPGETKASTLTERFGPPTAKVEKDGLELWVFTYRIRKVQERAFLGVIPTGESSDVVESIMPVGVRDGVVVHTYPSPSADEATKKALESMWDEYTTRR